MNVLFIAGTIGSDAELKFTQAGVAICRFSVATNYSYKKENETIEETEWHRCTLWAKRGEALHPHLTKGTKVTVNGRVKTTEYQGKDGQRKWSTEMIVNDVTLQGSSGKGGQGGGGGQPQQQRTQRPQQPDPTPFGQGGDDDIPF